MMPKLKTSISKIDYKLMREKRIKFYLLLSNITVICILFLIIIIEKYPNRFYLKYLYKEKLNSSSYELNPEFIKQADFCTIYNKPTNIVMLGNSLTQQIHWNELLERCDVTNRGVGSDITIGFIERLKYVIPLKPKICFIEGGVNDLSRNIEIKEIKTNINLIVDSLRKNNIIPVLTLVTYVSKNYRDSEMFNKKIKLLNNEYKEIIQNKQINFIDLNQKLSDEQFLKNEFQQNDGIHFNSSAYLVWKTEVNNLLKKLKL
jgi:lysophospholipase L1-like esterase